MHVHVCMRGLSLVREGFTGEGIKSGPGNRKRVSGRAMVDRARVKHASGVSPFFSFSVDGKGLYSVL